MKNIKYDFKSLKILSDGHIQEIPEARDDLKVYTEAIMYCLMTGKRTVLHWHNYGTGLEIKNEITPYYILDKLTPFPKSE